MRLSTSPSSDNFKFPDDRSLSGAPFESNARNVRLISLTMDPVDDTPQVLAKYGQSYGQDTGRWSFLTGDETEMHRLVGVSFLPPDTTGEFAYMPGNFAHTQRIALMDAKGHLVEYFDGLNQEAGNAVAEAIAKMKVASQ